MSETVHKYICEIFQLYVPGVGLLTPCFVPEGGILYIMIAPGEGILPLRVVSREFRGGRGGGGGMVLMKLIVALLYSVYHLDM